MSKPVKHCYEFGCFRVDVAERGLFRDGERVPVPPKAFDTLVALVQNDGHLLTKDELIKKVWPETFIEENNLTQQISSLRRALGEGDNGLSYIETVPRVGYRFAPGVREVWDEGEAFKIENHTKYRVIVKEEVYEETAPQRDRWPRSHIFSSRSRGLRISLALLSVSTLIGVALLLSVIRGKDGEQETNKTVKTVGFKSVAVLPFKSIGVAPGDEHLGLGMADTLIAKLSQLRQIRVRPISAVHRFTELQQDPFAVGRSLGVDAVLDGRIQRADGRIRVTVELLSVRDSVIMWTETLDEKSADIFTIQDQIAVRVARSLPQAVTGEESRLLARSHSENANAYEAYLKGRFFWNKRTPEGFKKALEHFEQAIRLDPNYGLAYAGLADAHAFSLPSQAPQARAAAMKALNLDYTLAEAHTSLAAISLFEWNWSEAEREFKRAIERGPNYATAHHWYAYYFAAMGNMEKALYEIRRAQELDPLSLIINTDLGQILYYSRQYDLAIDQLRKTVEMDQNFIMARYRLSEAYAQKGLHQQAIAEFNEAKKLSGTSPASAGLLGYTYAISGKRQEARKLISEWEKSFARSPRDVRHPYWIATVYTALGEKDQALRWLEKSYEQRFAELVLLSVEPRFDTLRPDPRFTSLLRRMNLAS